MLVWNKGQVVYMSAIYILFEHEHTGSRISSRSEVEGLGILYQYLIPDICTGLRPISCTRYMYWTETNISYHIYVLD